MFDRIAVVALILSAYPCLSIAQEPITYRSAIVALTDDPGSDDLIAVVHMAIYLLDEREAQLISAGAVWLDEEVESQERGIERLQDLIVANVDAARPAIRQRLGLPPL